LERHQNDRAINEKIDVNKFASLKFEKRKMTGRVQTAAGRASALSLDAEMSTQQDKPYSESLTKLQLHKHITNI
jgi:hypothetical protein